MYIVSLLVIGEKDVIVEMLTKFGWFWVVNIILVISVKLGKIFFFFLSTTLL